MSRTDDFSQRLGFWHFPDLISLMLPFGASIQVAPPMRGGKRPLSHLHRCYQGLKAGDIQCPSRITGKRHQAELGADFAEAAHEQRTLVHPLLDRPKAMLDCFAADIEYLRPRRHAVQHRLVLQPRQGPNTARAAWPQRAGGTRLWITAIDPFQIPQSAFTARRQDLAIRADVGVFSSFVRERVLGIACRVIENAPVMIDWLAMTAAMVASTISGVRSGTGHK